MARGKRVEIVKKTVAGPDGTPVEVDAKACTKCGEVKALTEFHKGISAGGRKSQCMGCVRRPKVNRLTRAWTSESYREYVRIQTEGEYVFLGEYKGARNKALHIHIDCGREWMARPGSFLSGTRCPYCHNNSKTRTDYIERIRSVVGDEYSVMSPYVHGNVHIAHRHNKCGHIWDVTPNSILNGSRCPACYHKSITRTHEEYIQKVTSLVGSEYSIIGTYINGRTKVEHRHNECGHIWKIRPDSFITGARCPRCCESKGEREVRNYLNKNFISFTEQFRFGDCKNKSPLPFDFAVECKSSSEVTVLIEYDGEQHFRPVDFAGRGEKWADRQFRQTQRNDRIKTDYCRANGIPLIRIDYTQFDEIEAILTRELTKYGVISGETGNRLTDENTTEKVSA
ncbi:hypothetical protein PASE110613_09445 [Paenibacillus sediminis]|uniref:Zn ribbon nucleic-acid-binding protein n=1 Tax=Paenibacillus sediminis TaxID=664909 RepID=A0ABS4H6Y8_9BACL|nr:hypothetical protein [Paenibacillus sediminis]MBP1938127.1 Zn ribbon nucleic-acid-binding protein [Paenibacillus sediminis]